MWLDKNFARKRVFNVNELRAIATFPASYKWPVGTPKHAIYDGFGKSLPPLFMKTIFKAAEFAAR